MMNATEAREYLKTAVQTECGREILRDLGYGAVIDAPEKGTDRGTIIVAEKVWQELCNRYPSIR